MAEFLTVTGVVSMALISVCAGVAIVAAFRLGGKLSDVEKWILAWVMFDFLMHVSLEGPFLHASLTGTVANSTHWTTNLWKEYGKADSRFLYSDPTVVSVMIFSCVFCIPANLMLIYAILTKRFYRHLLQFVLCVFELYGGWMILCPEWLTGSKSLVTDNFIYLWVYLVFFNMLWVVIPVALMCHSWVDVRNNGIAPHSAISSSAISKKQE